MYKVGNNFEKRSGILVVAFSIGPKPYLNCWSLKDQFYGSRTSKITCATIKLYMGLFFKKKRKMHQEAICCWLLELGTYHQINLGFRCFGCCQKGMHFSAKKEVDRAQQKSQNR